MPDDVAPGVTVPRMPLFERLPAIYQIRDAEQTPPGQLQAYLSAVEAVFGALHDNIAQLYDDLFIETCADWVVPYLGDLLGTSHLAGDPWTLRADVADTIAARRRKGTLAGIERVTFALTRWGVHCVELRDGLAWHHHLNHQRPDRGSRPPYAPDTRPQATRFTPVRGGTAAVRDPAMLSLTGTPFDPWARVADLRPPAGGAVRPNLPNLALFLWRLETYRVPRATPVAAQVRVTGAPAPAAPWVVRVQADALGRPVCLFNIYQYDPDQTPPAVTELDRVPGPILRARLDEASPAGNPEAYLAIGTYAPGFPALAAPLGEVGLQLHLPEHEFTGLVYPDAPPIPAAWTIRGANLCAWEAGVLPPPAVGDVLIDPELGRLLVAVDSKARADALETDLRVTYTYAAPGPVGAHPVSRDAPAATIYDESAEVVRVTEADGPDALALALANIAARPLPLVVQLDDSATYSLDLATVAGALDEDGGPNLFLARPLVLRAASGERPVLRLAQPLRLRAADPAHAGTVSVRLEGIFVTRGDDFPASEDVPLIARAAVNRLELVGVTLDPGGHGLPDGTRAPLRVAAALREPYGFAPTEEATFAQTPEVVMQRSVTGALRLDRGYTLSLADSIVDAGGAVGGVAAWAIAAAGDPANGWGPPMQFAGATVLGQTRVAHAFGRGGIFTQRLEAEDDQSGCVRYSCFSGDADRLPQNLGCVTATAARLRFSAVRHGDPAYARVDDGADFRIRERGPDDEAMGAYGFLRDASKLRNLRVRYREFMPVGVRPLLVFVT